jgi:predicted ATPase
MPNIVNALRYVITGMSGTGKTAVLEGLRTEGFPCFDEPGREVLNNGSAAAKTDPEIFISEMYEHSLRDYRLAPNQQLAFYDRGLPDIVAYANRFKVDATLYQEAAELNRYEPRVFVAPLFVNDDVRRASFDDYLHFHESLLNIYDILGYSTKVLPKGTVHERIEYIKDATSGA